MAGRDKHGAKKQPTWQPRGAPQARPPTPGRWLQVVHRIGRHFGFQAFNQDPRTAQVRRAQPPPTAPLAPCAAAPRAGPKPPAWAAPPLCHRSARRGSTQCRPCRLAGQPPCKSIIPSPLAAHARRRTTRAAISNKANKPGYTHARAGGLPSQGGEPAWTPATIFLVTDHLYHLLVKNYLRRDGAAGGTDDDRFGRAVFRLHGAIFQVGNCGGGGRWPAGGLA